MRQKNEEIEYLRGRALKHTTIAAVLSRLCSVVVMLFQTPLVLRKLGDEGFGVWVTITGAFALLSISDLGLGSGLQNYSAQMLGAGQLGNIRPAWRKSIEVTFLIGIIILIAIFLILRWVDLSALLKLGQESNRKEVYFSVGLASIIFCLGLPSQMATRVALATQNGLWMHFYTAAMGLLALVATWIYSCYSGRLFGFVVIALGFPLLANFALGIHILKKLPKSGGESAATNHIDLARSGLQYFLPQVGAAAVGIYPPLVLAAICGAAAVAPYNLSMRLLSLTTQAVGLFLIPLWPAYTEAKARHAWVWIKASYRKSFLATMILGVLPCLVFAGLGNVLLSLWTHSPISGFDRLLILAVGLWVACSNLSQPAAYLLNGLGFPRGQSIYGFGSVLITIFIMPFAVRKFGAIGLPLSCLVPFLLFNLPATLLEARYRLTRMI